MSISPEKNLQMFDMLIDGNIDRFNDERAKGTLPDFTKKNLRGIDMRRADLSGVSLHDAILSHADIRGLDLHDCDMEGASMKDAKISGVFFPENLAPQEIMMSVQFGTRMRVSR